MKTTQRFPDGKLRAGQLMNGAFDTHSTFRRTKSRWLHRVAGLVMVVGLLAESGSAPAQAAATYDWGNFVGLPGGWGMLDGSGSAARFNRPSGAAVDSAGNVFVADTYNSTIRQVSAAGEVTTLAGSAGNPGSADGTNSAAQFNRPTGVAVDSAGNVFVADTYNSTIRQVSAVGVVTTLAGSVGNPGSADGTNSAAQFNRPTGVAVDSAGNVFVVDGNSTIRMLRAIGTNWVVTTLAGSAGNPGSADGLGSAARFDILAGVAVDNAGNVFVADYGNCTIRKVSAAGMVTTLAGSAGKPGSVDGTNSAAQFNYPTGVAVDRAGNVFVADYGNSTIRQVSTTGGVTTLAGSAGDSGWVDGSGSTARFNYPTGVAVDSAGNVFVADTYNSTIRKASAAGMVTTLVGSAGKPGSADGPNSVAQFNYPTGVAVDSAGNVFVADTYNSTIRKVSAAGMVTTLAGSAGDSGWVDGPGSAAQFNYPTGVAADSVGNVFVADYGNSTIRKVSAAGVVTLLAGLAGNPGSADGPGSAARFNDPTGVAVDRAGNVFVADYGNSTIRKVSATGVVTTLAGLAGNPGSADGPGSAARFNNPTGVAVDSAGNVFVADTANSTIRKVSAKGVVTTLAGLAGNPGSADGPGSAARFNNPTGVAVDSAGNVFVADTANNTIRKVSAAGMVTTMGNYAENFTPPLGIAVSSAGILYVADSDDNRILKGTPNSLIPTVATLRSMPSEGTFVNYSMKIMLSCATKGASIRYTVDGTEPTWTSTIYKQTGIIITHSVTLNAKAFKGENTSTVLTASYTIIPPLPLTITSTSRLPDGNAQTKYTGRLKVSGGLAPHKWSLVEGSRLPAGLSLNVTTGIISGTPAKATARRESFTIKVTDAKQSGTKTLSLTVN